jgi:hypothetical protein
VAPGAGAQGPPRSVVPGAGRPWPEALEQVLGTCRAAAVFVGPGEMGPWQQREKYLALERQARDGTFPVIPVLLPRADPVLGFLGQNTWVDLRERPDDLELVRPGQGAEDTRRRASLAEIGEASWPVVKRLADERLLVTAPGSAPGIARAAEGPGEGQRLPVVASGGTLAGDTVEVAHEALIRHRERLKSWVNSDREFLLWRERFRALLAEGHRRNKDPGALLPPALLQEAERWLGERGDKLTAEERA